MSPFPPAKAGITFNVRHPVTQDLICRIDITRDNRLRAIEPLGWFVMTWDTDGAGPRRVDIGQHVERFVKPFYEGPELALKHELQRLSELGLQPIVRKG